MAGTDIREGVGHVKCFAIEVHVAVRGGHAVVAVFVLEVMAPVAVHEAHFDARKIVQVVLSGSSGALHNARERDDSKNGSAPNKLALVCM